MTPEVLTHLNTTQTNGTAPVTEENEIKVTLHHYGDIVKVVKNAVNTCEGKFWVSRYWHNYFWHTPCKKVYI